MKEFEIGKNIEINGTTINSVLASAKGKASEIILTKYLKDQNIKDIDPEGWYPATGWLMAMKGILEKHGKGALYEIGLKIPENAKFPPLKDIYQALESIDIAYHLNHRKDGKVMFNQSTGEIMSGIGNYKVKEADKKNNRIVLLYDNPYPCDFDKGIATAVAKMFEPNSTVVHEHTSSCRHQNGENCTYIVTW